MIFYLLKEDRESPKCSVACCFSVVVSFMQVSLVVKASECSSTLSTV